MGQHSSSTFDRSLFCACRYAAGDVLYSWGSAGSTEGYSEIHVLDDDWAGVDWRGYIDPEERV